MHLTLSACWLLLYWVSSLVAEVAALRVVTAPKYAQSLSRRAAINASASKAATAAAVAAATSAMLLVGTRADAADADSVYNAKVAAKYDQLDGGSLAAGLGLEQLRRSMTASAAGHVLEIAVGTGLNLPNYNRAKITKLDCIDLSTAMLQQVLTTIYIENTQLHRSSNALHFNAALDASLTCNSVNTLLTGITEECSS
jgi:hypothetical protein